MANNKLKNVFDDTEKYYTKNFDNDVNSYKVTNSEIKYPKVNQMNKKGKITIVPMDTITASSVHTTGKTAILNMTSWKNPGGGVRRGAQAQEECLCRCTNLVYTLEKQDYPIKYTELIYSHDITVFKDFKYNYITPYKVDVITSPAPNIRKGKPDNYESLLTEKIELMIYSAYKNGVDNLILGAWVVEYIRMNQK